MLQVAQGAVALRRDAALNVRRLGEQRIAATRQALAELRKVVVASAPVGVAEEDARREHRLVAQEVLVRQPDKTVMPVPGILRARTLEWVAISFSNA